MRAASAISASAATSVIAIAATTSQAAALPAIIRTGITSGADGGTNDSTRARLEFGSSSAPKLRKNDAAMITVSGAVTAWISSWRGRSAPATAKAHEYSPKPSTNHASTTPTAETTSPVTSSCPVAGAVAGAEGAGGRD